MTYDSLIEIFDQPFAKKKLYQYEPFSQECLKFLCQFLRKINT